MNMPRDIAGDKPPFDVDDVASPVTPEHEKKERIVKESAPSIIGSGWGVQKTVQMSGDRPVQFKVDEGKEYLVKFIQETPFANFYQHWPSGLPADVKQRSYVCLGVGCPLCAYGDKPKAANYFNLLDVTEEPVLKVWYASPDPAGAIRDRSESKRSSPLNRADLYFIVSKHTQANGIPTYTVDYVKEADLEEDWGIKPLVPATITELSKKAYTSDIVRVNSKAELQALAEKYLSED